MAIPLPIRVLPLVATALAPALAAQVPWSDGSLVGLPTMFSVTETTAKTTLLSPDRGAEGYSKPPGFVGTAPQPVSVAGGVDFSAKALFRRCKQISPRLPLPEIDAFTLGLDVLPTTAGGKIKVGPMRWVGIIYSVAAGAKGTKGSRIRYEAVNSKSSNGADMFNYVYKGSVCLPPDMIGTTFRSWDATEAGLPAGDETHEVDALDAYATLYELGLAAELGLPPNPTFFFSVEGSDENLKRVPLVWWGKSKPSGGTIFRTTWNPKDRVWTCPVIFKTYDEIGLKQPCEDVDALAIDGKKRHLMFSTRIKANCPKRNQLLFTDISTDFAAAVTVTYEDNTPVTGELGIGDADDVDALCGLDPTCNNAPGRLQIERVLGYSNGRSPRLPFPKLETQAYRRRTAARTEFYEINMLGGMPGQFAVLWASPPDGFGKGILIPIGATVVPRRSLFAGNPITPMLMPVPPNVGKLSVELTFASFYFQPPYQLKFSVPLCLQL